MAVRKKEGVEQRQLTVQFPNAAGIDVGAKSHFVALPPDRDAKPVREFEAFTDALIEMAQWLRAHEVDTVVMESTGVYWIPLFELLESKGFVVYLVNARHVKNVSGKKSDVLDCQWLQQLMSFGLLKPAYRPPEQVCALRALSRQRESLLKDQARQVQHMQKALTQMNVQLANVLSDIVGESGQKIIRAIVAGERDAHTLAALCNYRVRAPRAQVARSLLGNWREEHLFCLAQALHLFDSYQGLIAQTDTKIEAMLARMQRVHEKLEPAPTKGRAKNAPHFDLRQALYGWARVDLTLIDGIDVTTALKILAEIGPDLSKFKNAKHFASWQSLCPGTKISGGKVLCGATQRLPNRVARALKLAAQGLHRSHSAMGAFYRRIAARESAGKAITATAHKLARHVYAMLTHGEAYVQQSQTNYEAQFRDRSLRNLQRRAASLGFQLHPLAPSSASKRPSYATPNPLYS